MPKALRQIPQPTIILTDNSPFPGYPTMFNATRAIKHGRQRGRKRAAFDNRALHASIIIGIGVTRVYYEFSSAQLLSRTDTTRSGRVAFAGRLFDIAPLTDTTVMKRTEGLAVDSRTAKKPTEFPNGKAAPDVSARHFKDMWLGSIAIGLEAN